MNLGLRVLGRRPDGYHRIRTVLASVALHDTLRFEAGGREHEIECAARDVPSDGTNLALRAVAALEDLLGARLPPVRIRLTKRIPPGRGLGGGSSDAAVTLLALNRAFGCGQPRPALHRAAARIGMDVPFFLYGGEALATGRGDRLFPFPDGPPLALVLLLPNFSVPTAEAYRRLPRSLRLDSARSLPPGTMRRSPGAPPEGMLDNDLERSGVFQVSRTGDARPGDSIARMRRALSAAGAVGAAMSGSGSATYGIFPDEAAAARAARALAGPEWTAHPTRLLSRAEHQTVVRGRREEVAAS